MADLDFSHHVSEVPAGAQLPEPYKRQIGAEVSKIPDFQGTYENYAASTNWMSAIGSEVAIRSSNALASKLGGEAGKNPQGDLTPSFTNFDEHYAQAYNTQAQATLGLQANKLITDSNLEMARAPRISADMIARTNGQIAIGLKNIFKNAPAEIRPELENHYGNVAIGQTASLTERMIGEQREDQRQTTIASTHTNAQNAYAIGARGDEKAGKSIVEATKRLNDSAYANRVIDKDTAKSNSDSVRQSYQTGKLIHDYEKSRKDGKGEDFLKSLADKSDVGDPDYQVTTNGLMQYINHQDSLRSQDQQLRLAKFNETIAKDPVSPTISDELADLKNNVTPVAYEKAQLAYIQARKAFERESTNQQDLVRNWSDSSALARADSKSVNKTFDTLVGNVVEKQGISKDDAEVQVAISAGAPVPIFVKTLNDKATSGNPANIESAADQIQSVKDAEGGHALIGLSKQAQAIAYQFQHQRGSMPDSDLARKITDRVLNQDPSMQATLDNSWNVTLNAKGATGPGAKSLASFALNQVGVNSDKLGGKYFETIYGNDIYEQLRSNFDATKGDYATALQMTKDYVDQNYGETRVNGDIHFSDKPIEKSLGYKDPDVVPYIHQDLLNQLAPQFEKHKDEGNEYWQVQPPNMKAGGIFRSTYEPATITRHIKTDKGEKVYSYPVNLIGRPGNQWDVVVQTPSGPRNLFLVAPHLGVMTYKPNKEAIDKNYNEHLKQKGWF